MLPRLETVLTATPPVFVRLCAPTALLVLRLASLVLKSASWTLKMLALRVMQVSHAVLKSVIHAVSSLVVLSVVNHAMFVTFLLFLLFLELMVSATVPTFVVNVFLLVLLVLSFVVKLELVARHVSPFRLSMLTLQATSVPMSSALLCCVLLTRV